MSFRKDYYPPAGTVYVPGYPQLEWKGQQWWDTSTGIPITNPNTALGRATVKARGKENTVMQGAYYDEAQAMWYVPDEPGSGGPLARTGGGGVMFGPGDKYELLAAVVKIAPALFAPPAKPAPTSDPKVAFQNQFLYLEACAKFVQRQAQLFVGGDALVTFFARRAAGEAISIGDVVKLGAEGLGALTTLPSRPDASGDIAKDIANMNTYLESLMAHLGRAEIIAAIGEGAAAVLPKAKLAA